MANDFKISQKLKVELEPDIYCYTFVKIYENELPPGQISYLFKKCFLVFILQMFLIGAYVIENSD